MSTNTRIEWADATWSPITGCTPISEGCEHCYAARMAKRLAGRFGYPKDEPFKPTFHLEKLDEPQKWKKPKRIFVCSMGDLFHETIESKYVHFILHACELNPQHIYIFPTKRPKKMLEIMSHWNPERRFPNWWLGVTAENQRTADERIPVLLQIPAAVRFVSVEPMLEPISFKQWLLDVEQYDSRTPWKPEIDWVICGGETGPGARPMHPDWVRSLRDQCQVSNVPFFFKGWGDWEHESMADFTSSPGAALSSRNATYHIWGGGTRSYHIGKKHSGRLLDGVEWNQFSKIA
jgi:protein gp37